LLALVSYPLAAQRDAAIREGRVSEVAEFTLANASITAVKLSTKFADQTQGETSGTWIISPVRIGMYHRHFRLRPQADCCRADRGGFDSQTQCKMAAA
jgi:hypothetical protein